MACAIVSVKYYIRGRGVQRTCHSVREGKRIRKDWKSQRVSDKWPDKCMFVTSNGNITRLTYLADRKNNVLYSTKNLSPTAFHHTLILSLLKTNITKHFFWYRGPGLVTRPSCHTFNISKTIH